jgi:hypothetical protein
MRTNYPEDYKGPKAGVSNDQEWLDVTEYQAFKYVRFEDWSYSDFDCWLAARNNWHYERGSSDTAKSLREAYESKLDEEYSRGYDKGLDDAYISNQSSGLVGDPQ